MNDTVDDTSVFSPRNFLRARRPEKFSDSIGTERSLLGGRFSGLVVGGR